MKAGAVAERSAERKDELSLRHPAMLAAAVFTALAIAYGVTFQLYDADLWQHLAVGRAIWQLHRVPTVNLWVWPLYGATGVCPSWLFRALLWPFWAAGGVGGLFVWRWLTALSAFALLWAAARRLGARGFSALFVLALAALSFRHRSQVRPDTLVAVLLALELWLLSAWRADGRPRRVAVALTLWVWINAHVSWPLGFALLGAFAAEAVRRPTEARGRHFAALLPYAITALVGLALGLVHPSGWRALVEPFQFVLAERATPLYDNIAELQPLMWNVHWKTGLALLIVGWPLLIGFRAARRRVDLAELIACALFTTLALTSQRFAGLYALVAAPFVARDLAEWSAARAERGAAVAGAPAWGGFALLVVATLAVSALEWTRRDVPRGMDIDFKQYPVGACDFIASRALRGPMFNEYYYGGYLLWRFWPDRERLPFMDAHQSGTPADRALYPFIFRSEPAWHELDARRHFELLVVDGSIRPVPGNRLPDLLDADPTWALVFRDDQACLYVRRGGLNDATAEREGYRVVPGGSASLPALGAACERNAGLRAAVRGELERQADSSPYNSRALSLLANIAIIEGRGADARALMMRALAVEPGLPSGHERLGMIALGSGDARQAVVEFQREARTGSGSDELDLRLGDACRAAGDTAGARAAYDRYLARRPGDARAIAGLDSLKALDATRRALDASRPR